MSEERAEGFWWVRMVSVTPGEWTVARLLSSGVIKAADWEGGWTEDVAEWGPYLGKEPGGACGICGGRGRSFDEQGLEIYCPQGCDAAKLWQARDSEGT